MATVAQSASNAGRKARHCWVAARTPNSAAGFFFYQKVRITSTLLLIASLIACLPRVDRKGDIAIALGNCFIGLALWANTRRLALLAVTGSFTMVAVPATLAFMRVETGTFAIAAAVSAAAFALSTRTFQVAGRMLLTSFVEKLSMAIPAVFIVTFSWAAVSGLEPGGMSIASGSSCVAFGLAARSRLSRQAAIVAPLVLIARFVHLIANGIEPGIYLIAFAASAVGAVIAFNGPQWRDYSTAKTVTRKPVSWWRNHALNPSNRSCLAIYKPLLMVLAIGLTAGTLVAIANGPQPFYTSIATSGGIVASAIISLRYSQRIRDNVLLSLVATMLTCGLFALLKSDANLFFNVALGGMVGVSILASQPRGDARGAAATMARSLIGALPFVLAAALVISPALIAWSLIAAPAAITTIALLVMHLPISFTNVLMALSGHAKANVQSPWSA